MVGLAFLPVGGAHLFAPEVFLLFVAAAHLAVLLFVVFVGAVQQVGHDGEHALARAGRCHGGQVEVGRIVTVLVEEAYLGEEGTATGQGALSGCHNHVIRFFYPVA